MINSQILSKNTFAVQLKIHRIILQARVTMQLIGWNFTILLLISVWVLVKNAPASKVISDEGGHEPDDYALEMEAIKVPIIGNVIRYVSTMYADKLDYKWVEKSFGKQPEFCHHYECPKYKVLCKNVFYEVRKYEAAKWAKVPIKWDPESDDDIFMVAFRKLANYIKGANIKMTVPVLVHVKKGNKTEEGKPPCKEMSMKFYIPSEFQKDTPVPKNENITIVESPEVVVYVKMFGGYVLPSVWKPMVERFHKVLEEYKQKVDLDFGSMGATYDKPSILMNRHNEIVFRAAEVKEDEKYCQLS